MDALRIFILFTFWTFRISMCQDYDDERGEVKPLWSRCSYSWSRFKNGRAKIRARGRLTKFVCNSGFELVGKRFATCVRGKWNHISPVCVARGCYSLPEPANGRVKETYRGAYLVYECLPGYSLNGPENLHCDGDKWSDEIPTCEANTDQSETSCDFEDPDLCGWINDPADDFDWLRHNLETPSGHVGTGPSHDHTFGKGKAGFYLYEEASAPRRESDVARLFSPVYPRELSQGCFVFWYHMYGAGMGELRVYLKAESYIFGEIAPSWRNAGDQGNEWHRGTLTIPLINENFQIIIEGLRGSTYIGDMAIDDVRLVQTVCSAIDLVNLDVEMASVDSCRGRCRERDASEVCGCSDYCTLNNSCCADYFRLCNTETESNNTYDSDNPEELASLDKPTAITKLQTIKPLTTTALKISNFTTIIPTVKTATAFTSSSSITTTTFTPSTESVQSMTSRTTNPSTWTTTTIPVTANTQGTSIQTTKSTPSTTTTTPPATTAATTRTATTSTVRTTLLAVISNTQSTTSTTKSTLTTATKLPTTTTTKSFMRTTTRSPITTTNKSPMTTTISQPTTMKTTQSPASTVQITKSQAVPMTTTRLTTATTTNQRTMRTTQQPVITPQLTSQQIVNITANPSPVSTITSFTYTPLPTVSKTTPNTITTQEPNTSFFSTSVTTKSTVSNTVIPTIISTLKTVPTSPILTSTASSISTSITPRYHLRPRSTTKLTSPAPETTSKATTAAWTPYRLRPRTTENITTLSSSTTSSPARTTIKSTRFLWKTSTPMAVTTRRLVIGTTSQISITTTNQPHNSTRNLASGEEKSVHAIEKTTSTPVAGIVVAAFLVVVLAGGTVYYMFRKRKLLHKHLSEDSEIRFLSDNEEVEFSDPSALDRIKFSY